jgi:hypothetical protein
MHRKTLNLPIDVHSQKKVLPPLAGKWPSPAYLAVSRKMSKSAIFIARFSVRFAMDKREACSGAGSKQKETKETKRRS